MHEFELDDSAARLLLETALRCFDRASEARALLDRDGLTQPDRFGVHKPHPAITVERDQTSQLMTALKQLQLDVMPPGPPGRPAKS